MANRTLTCEIELPRGFRVEDVLGFHLRDPLQIAERVERAEGMARLSKAFLWRQAAVAIEAVFRDGGVWASCTVESRAAAGDDALDEGGFIELLHHMLGLDQPVNSFEATYQDHPQLGWLIRRNAGLRVPQAATAFEAVSWAILGQQISLVAAIALRRRLIEAVGRRHQSGLLCYPDAASVLALGTNALRALGCSGTKVSALHGLAAAVLSGELPLEHWRQEQLTPLAIENISAALQKVRGIGPWTVNYALLRGFSWLDGSLDGDVAVRRGLQRLLLLDEAPDAKATRLWLEAFAPWRALAAAHLWTLKGNDKASTAAARIVAQP